MELAVRSLRIGHCLHKGLEKHVELFKSHRSPPVLSRPPTSEQQEQSQV